jgi:hypothetical protein
VFRRLPDIELDFHETSTYLSVSMNGREAGALNATEDL